MLSKKGKKGKGMQGARNAAAPPLLFQAAPSLPSQGGLNALQGLCRSLRKIKVWELGYQPGLKQPLKRR